MNLLIIGGTKFVGRHIAQAAVSAGASVTLFHRGQTQAPELADCDHVYGDRVSDLHRLGDRTWHAVIDTCAYVPSEAQIAAKYFAGRTGSFTFISSISVVDAERATVLDEDVPVDAVPAGADWRVMVPQTYGAFKALCEQVVISTFRGRAIVLRPGLVAGPYDPTDRFTYWPLRVAAGGPMIAPDGPQRTLQYIDARDLAQFAVRLVQSGAGGVYNVVTDPGSMTFGDLFEGASRASGSVAQPRYVSEDVLLELGVEPWSDLPLWLPRAKAFEPMTNASNRRARGQGLRTRSIYETARDVLNWARAANKGVASLQAGLSREREAELLGLVRPSTGSVRFRES